MLTIGSIGEFDVSNLISWDNYAEQLKFFLEANEITNAEKKRAVLLAVCRIKTLGVLRSLLAPESPSTKSYDDLIKVLKEHFAPTSSEIYRRFQFHKRLQHNNEAISSYVTELRLLAEECNFGAMLTEQLRDQLVCSIKDEALQRRLLAESTLTFNEASSRAVAAKSTTEQAKHIHSQKFNTGNSTNLIRQQSNNNKRTFQKSSSSQSKPENAQSADVICYGSGGHYDCSSCKFRDVTCRFCKKKGHIERTCNAKHKNDSMPHTGHMQKNSSTHAVKSESVNEAAAIYNLSDLKNSKCKQMKRNISIQLGEGEYIMELDSGSDYSIISSDELDCLWPNKKPKIFPLTFQLCDYQKSPIRI
ncbi:hypothetical protein AVEN_274630-1 [Araneus ventricosus]|uniref:Paraneoplastic antigen Ma-like C-terminal domain-containing protein n=1 Tax=Araneus ventricosus TaxID=182803 RepID=A0A4Y2V3D5_ARAVE|nr:hypothetical protein AVEN_274630-1 [Araneus ventricosus]